MKEIEGFFYICKGYFYIPSPIFLLDYWFFSQFLGTFYKTEILALYNRSWSIYLMTLLNIFFIAQVFFYLCSQTYQFLMPLVIESWFERLFPLKSNKEFPPCYLLRLVSFHFLYLNIDPSAVFPGKWFEVWVQLYPKLY